MKWKKRDIGSKTSYFEYYKTVIEKVSFCQNLLSKEYQKAKKVIDPHELPHFNEWFTSKVNSSNKGIAIDKKNNNLIGS